MRITFSLFLFHSIFFLFDFGHLFSFTVSDADSGAAFRGRIFIFMMELHECQEKGLFWGWDGVMSSPSGDDYGFRWVWEGDAERPKTDDDRYRRDVGRRGGSALQMSVDWEQIDSMKCPTGWWLSPQVHMSAHQESVHRELAVHGIENREKVSWV